MEENTGARKLLNKYWFCVTFTKETESTLGEKERNGCSKMSVIIIAANKGTWWYISRHSNWNIQSVSGLTGSLLLRSTGVTKDIMFL